METKKKRDIDFEIANIKTIFEIEGMKIKPDEEVKMRDYLTGKITDKEYIGELKQKED